MFFKCPVLNYSLDSLDGFSGADQKSQIPFFSTYMLIETLAKILAHIGGVTSGMQWITPSK